MSERYIFEYSEQFAKDFENFTEEQQDAILDFLDIYETYGLTDFSRYPGKIIYSWHNLELTDSNYHYTKSNNLWHYHLGNAKPPKYRQSISGKYQTSDRLLHFIREKDRIILVDVLDHYKANGKFWLPLPNQL